MSRVVLDVSVSLDGFTTGPDVGEAEPMGIGGERLHEWMGAGGADAGVREAVDASVGAVVIGRRTFDLGLRPWDGTPWPGVPSFVVTHRTRENLLAGNGGTFVFDGLAAAPQGGPARRGAHPPRPRAPGRGHAAVRRRAGRAGPGGRARPGDGDAPALPRRPMRRHHAMGPRRSTKMPVGPSGPIVASPTIESVPSVTVSRPVWLFMSVAA